MSLKEKTFYGMWVFIMWGTCIKILLLRKFIDFLTKGNLQWNKMKDSFEEFIYPSIRLKAYGHKEQYEEELFQYFPKEKDNIHLYFEDIQKTAKWFFKHIGWKTLPKPWDTLSSPLQFSKNVLFTTKDYLDFRFQDPILKSLIVSRWGDYGLPPSKSAFIIHSLIEEHYLNGGWYPEGGSNKIAEYILPKIRKNGGDVLLTRRVDEILIKNNTAIGVKVYYTQGEQIREEKGFYADVIVSNAGAYNTYKRLFQKPSLSETTKQVKNIQNKLEELFLKSISNVTLYIGFKNNAEDYGIQGRNYWIYSNKDHNEIFEKTHTLLNDKPSGVYLSFPSLKHSIAKDHTAEIINFIRYEPFEPWKSYPRKNRGDMYLDLKNQITERLVSYVSRYFPEFPYLIEYKELYPISNEFFSLHPKGTIYGIPYTTKRFEKTWIGTPTNIKNLYVTGVESSTPSFAAAMMGGFMATSAIMGFKHMTSLWKLFNTVKV